MSGSQELNAVQIAQMIHELSLKKNLDAETLKDTMESLEAPFNEKLDAIRNLMQYNSKNIASIQVDIDAYRHAQKTKKALERQNQRLMDYLTTAVTATGHDTVRTGKHVFKVKHKSYVTEILDETVIPDEFKEQETTWKVDKAAIGKLIRSGKEVPGAQVVENFKTAID